MCRCNLINAEMSKDDIRITCECGVSREVDAETMATLKVIRQYLVESYGRG